MNQPLIRPAPEATAAAAVRCRDVPIPPAASLSCEAYAGRACFACGQQLTRGAVHVGRATGTQGVHVLDTDVYACP